MPLLKWKPASDITAYRRQHAINELFIADERENNAVNRKHRKTLVSSPPVYAGNGIWEDLKLLWGYYLTPTPPPEIPPSGISRLNDLTFFVVFYAESNTNAIYTNANGNAIYTNAERTIVMLNSQVDLAYGLVRGGGAKSLPNIPAGSSRQYVIDRLNTALDGVPFLIDGSDRKLRASLDPTDKLTLTLVTNSSPPYNPFIVPSPSSSDPYPRFAGLFFGDSPNGSTALGATTVVAAGVGGGALLITQGNSSVTSQYKVADPDIYT